jgi:hypothetical protein
MIKLSRVMPGRLKLTCIAVAAAGSAMMSAANAQDGLDLAKRSGCTTCHSTDAKMVGPPFKLDHDAGGARVHDESHPPHTNDRGI